MNEKEINQMKNVPISLGTIIKVYNSERSSVSSFCRNKEETVSCDSKSFLKLPRFLDPNLGLTKNLLTLNLCYEANMSQPWNIEPYFLNTLSQSDYVQDFKNSVLVFGGVDPTNASDLTLGTSIFEYNLRSKLCHYYGCMMEPRSYHATSLMNSFIYITGGYSPLKCKNGEMLAVPYTDKLDIKSTLWKRCAQMNTARAGHAMVAVDRFLYVFGGRDSSGKILSTVEIYNEDANTWKEIACLPRPLIGLSATYVENKIWLFGGITLPNGDVKSSRFISEEVYSFIPSEKKWHLEQPLPVACAFSSCVSKSKTIWIIGGCCLPLDSNEQILMSFPDIWCLQLDSNERSWNRAGLLSHSTHSSSATLIGSKIYVFGGMMSKSKDVSDNIEIFNISTNILEKSGKLPVRVTGLSVVNFQNCILKNGKNNKEHFFFDDTKEISKDKYLISTDKKCEQNKEVSSRSECLADSKFSNSVTFIHHSPKQKFFTRNINISHTSSMDDPLKPAAMFLPGIEKNNHHTYTSSETKKNLHKECLSNNRNQFKTTLKVPINSVSTEALLSKPFCSKTEMFLECRKVESIVDIMENLKDFSTFKPYSPPTKWEKKSDC